MKKDEIIAALTEAAIEHDPKMNKADLEKLLPKPQSKVVYCGRQPIFENGERYEPGDEIPELTEERIKALGSLVTRDKPE